MVMARGVARGPATAGVKVAAYVQSVVVSLLLSAQLPAPSVKSGEVTVVLSGVSPG